MQLRQISSPSAGVLLDCVRAATSASLAPLARPPAAADRLPLQGLLALFVSSAPPNHRAPACYRPLASFAFLGWEGWELAYLLSNKPNFGGAVLPAVAEVIRRVAAHDDAAFDASNGAVERASASAGAIRRAALAVLCLSGLIDYELEAQPLDAVVVAYLTEGSPSRLRGLVDAILHGLDLCDKTSGGVEEKCEAMRRCATLLGEAVLIWSSRPSAGASPAVSNKRRRVSREERGREYRSEPRTVQVTVGGGGEPVFLNVRRCCSYLHRPIACLET